ncbi:MAG TPA: phage Gp37/Gp68 family protein [Micromonosporaceae bacterium]|nr:phage Gp37/Gp68 family protein [Micromonosporaceae bacterium]
MGDRSAIEWTEATWNPTTGCDKVSRGCDNCYALTLAKRLKAMGQPRYQTDGDPRTSGPGFGLAFHPDALDLPATWRRSRLVFVNSMSDLFHARVPVAFIRQVFEVMATTPQHTYQVLTKRARRLRRLADSLPWPDNVWMGVSVEDATVLDRVDDLRAVPAAVRFLSCEPLLGPMPGLSLGGIGWVIAGGESGADARPMDPGWVVDLRDQCLAAGVPFFFKQWGGRTQKAGGRELDGRTWDDMPQTLVLV